MCSTTIWIGHLAKTVKQAQISSAFEEFGQVKSVDVSEWLMYYKLRFDCGTISFPAGTS